MTDPALPAAAPDSAAAQRAEALAARFRDIAATRMRGLPLVNPALQVETLGFARQRAGEDASPGLLGVLITPWCMNLIWLADDPAAAPADGELLEHHFGGQRLSFIGARDEVFGPYQSCSLFSPMFEFADQQSARDTAAQVLALLRQAPSNERAALNRRALLFGRLPGAAR